jgi:HAD superfamily hydrolase (TIGR01549 family)
MQVDAIIFDMDGTLFDSSTTVPEAYVRTVREFAGIDVTYDDVFERYWLGPPIGILTSLLDAPATSAHVARYHEHLADTAEHAIEYDGVVDMLGALAEANVPRAVFTGADTTSCKLLVSHMQLDQWFEGEHLLLGTDLVGAAKPAPDGVLYACKLLGIEPSRAAYVGDSRVDHEAARAAGCRAIAAGWGHMHPAEPDVDVVASHPSDLLALL